MNTIIRPITKKISKFNKSKKRKTINENMFTENGKVDQYQKLRRKSSDVIESDIVRYVNVILNSNSSDTQQEVKELTDNGAVLFKYNGPIEEFISTEKNYVENLRKCILFYYKEGPLVNLVKRKYDLFGNIECILEFHENDFLPMLENNRDNEIALLENMYNYIKNDEFYIYITYARKSRVRTNLLEEFKVELNEYEEKMNMTGANGLDSLLTQPVQRLPRYKLLLESMIKNNFKRRNKQILMKCVKTHHALENFLKNLNGFLKIDKIENMEDMHTFNLGLYKGNECFEIHEVESNFSCESEVFVYQNGLIFTELRSPDKIILRGIYLWNNCHIFPYQHMFIMKTRNNQNEYVFKPLKNSKSTIIPKWYNMIIYMIYKSGQEESGISCDNEFSILNSNIDADDTKYANVKEHLEDFLNEFIENEKFYIRCLRDNILKGVENCYDIFGNCELTLFDIITNLIKLHENKILPILNNNRNDIENLLNDFQTLIQNNEFYVYVIYDILKSKRNPTVDHSKNLMLNGPAFQNNDEVKRNFNVSIKCLRRYEMLLNKIISIYYKSHRFYQEEIRLMCHSILCNFFEVVSNMLKISQIEGCDKIIILNQGMIRKCGTFFVTDCNCAESKHCEIFLFEKALMYTKYGENEKLIYCNHYPLNEIGFETYTDKFVLYNKKSPSEKCTFVASKCVIDDWINLFMIKIDSL